MKFKKLAVAVTALAVLVFGAGLIGAQELTPEAWRGEGLLREIVDIIAEETGLTAREIVQRVRDGETLAEIITASGGDVQTVTDQIVIVITERVNQAVANGRLTQERADVLLADLETRVVAVLNGDYDGLRFERGDRVRAAVALNVVELAAEQTGLSVQEIVQQRRDGKSLATILTENGVDVQAFIDDAVAQVDARLAEEVAAGRITQEQADQSSAQFRERLTEQLNSTEPLREREGRRGGRGA